MSKPTKFEDLDVNELRRSAVEDFAVPVEKSDNKKSVIAALLEGGVEWADYVAQHPEVKPEPVAEVTADREQEPNRGNVVTSKTMAGSQDVIIRTAEPIDTGAQEAFLVKMTRENLRYDTLGYSFTKEHPYALVKPEDLDYLLTKEDGFRQAYPSELSEFYG